MSCPLSDYTQGGSSGNSSNKVIIPAGATSFPYNTHLFAIKQHSSDPNKVNAFDYLNEAILHLSALTASTEEGRGLIRDMRKQGEQARDHPIDAGLYFSNWKAAVKEADAMYRTFRDKYFLYSQKQQMSGPSVESSALSGHYRLTSPLPSNLQIAPTSSAVLIDTLSAMSDQQVFSILYDGKDKQYADAAYQYWAQTVDTESWRTHGIPDEAYWNADCMRQRRENMYLSFLGNPPSQRIDREVPGSRLYSIMGALNGVIAYRLLREKGFQL